MSQLIHDSVQTEADAPARLREIVRRSAYLWERRLGTGTTQACGEDPIATERLRHWNRRLAPVGLSGQEALVMRLAWDGLEPAAGSAMLRDDRPSPFDELPAWAHTVSAIRAEAMAMAAALDDSAAAVPFRALFEPLRRLARSRLDSRLQAVRAQFDGVFDDACLVALDEALIERLSSAGAMTLQQVFEATVPVGERLLLRFAAQSGAPARARYERFVSVSLADGFDALFARYPVLARLWGTVIDDWAEASALLLMRTLADLPAIASMLPVRAEAARRVNSLTLSLSDAHRGGRGTVIVHFDDGARIVYKPKNLGLDVAFSSLIAWCETYGAPWLPKAPRVLDRGDYGWCEFIDQLPCPDVGALRRYYARAGALMALMHVLRGTDAHFENLIAHGEHPCLVDTETLLHPEAPLLGAVPAQDQEQIAAPLLDSVARTGLLPRWEFGADGREAYDVGGLAGVSASATGFRTLIWEATNTDAMHLRLVSAPPRAAGNITRVGGTAVDPQSYGNDVQAGFEATYGFLRAHRAALIAPDGPLQPALQTARVRHVFRATRVYTVVLQHALMPERLGNGADFSIELERLACGYMTAGRRPDSWSVLLAECCALGRLDIPYFCTNHDAHHIDGDAGLHLPGFFRTSGWADVRRQFDRLCEADLRLQRSVIRASFEACAARGASATPAAKPRATCGPGPDPLAAAHAIAGRLLRTAVDTGGEAPVWLSLNYVHDADRFRVAATDDTLYEGRLGIALFLAAFHVVTGSRCHGNWARRLLDPLARRIEAASIPELQRLVGTVGLGAGSGAGAAVYALTRAAGLMARSEWLEPARRLALALSDPIIAVDNTLDVIGGASGSLAALLALHVATGDADVLARARSLGDHLVCSQQADGAWPVGGSRRMSGYAHGAAGIADMLDRLATTGGDARHAAAALAGRGFERTLFDAGCGNWRDELVSDREALRVQWCRGAPGIALARLSALQAEDAAACRDEIDCAVRTTLAAGESSRDHACCGTVGRLEAVWMAAHALDRPDWRAAAEDLAAALRQRARGLSYRLTLPRGGATFHPGFFQGVAGIGYQWLRMLRPELPSVLAFR